MKYFNLSVDTKECYNCQFPGTDDHPYKDPCGDMDEKTTKCTLKEGRQCFSFNLDGILAIHGCDQMFAEWDREGFFGTDLVCNGTKRNNCSPGAGKYTSGMLCCCEQDL